VPPAPWRKAPRACPGIAPQDPVTQFKKVEVSKRSESMRALGARALDRKKKNPVFPCPPGAHVVGGPQGPRFYRPGSPPGFLRGVAPRAAAATHWPPPARVNRVVGVFESAAPDRAFVWVPALRLTAANPPGFSKKWRRRPPSAPPVIRDRVPPLGPPNDGGPEALEFRVGAATPRSHQGVNV